MFTQLNQYHVILELDPAFQLDTSALKHLYVRSADHRAAGAAEHACQRIEQSLAPITINHQGLFPSVTLSFNLAPGTSLGDAVDRHSAAEATVGMPASLIASFQGTAQAFQASLKSQP